MTTKETKSRKPRAVPEAGSPSQPLGACKLVIEVLDPAPNGHCLEEERAFQVAEDCAEFGTFSTIEPTGLAFVKGKAGSMTLRRHRIGLVVQEQRLSEVIAHVRAYCKTILEGHPIMISIEPVGFIG